MNNSTALPEAAAARKEYPLYRGLLRYFPDALAAVAHVSYQGNKQHHPDKPIHWDKAKSTDHEDALMRHLLEGDYDKVAWRALAALQIKLEGEHEAKREMEIGVLVLKHLQCKQPDRKGAE